jgi:hypothetical protein
MIDLSRYFTRGTLNPVNCKFQFKSSSFMDFNKKPNVYHNNIGKHYQKKHFILSMIIIHGE